MDNSTNELLEQIVNAHGMNALKNWQDHWPPNYNVAPTQNVPVAFERDGARGIETVRWGMVAPYAKEFGGKPVINARIETVDSNGMFKGPFRDHGVVVPALGYYEWQEKEDGKQPFFIRLVDEPLALAGIVRTWHDPALPRDNPATARLSMAIITMDAHVIPGEVHDREPAKSWTEWRNSSYSVRWKTSNGSASNRSSWVVRAATLTAHTLEVRALDDLEELENAERTFLTATPAWGLCEFDHYGRLISLVSSLSHAVASRRRSGESLPAR